MEPIKYYQRKFQNLRRLSVKGGAPHKPILLLAVIEMYELGYFTGNRFPFSRRLFDSFFSIWKELVGEHDFFHPSILNPIWRLKKDGFWQSVPKPGMEFRSDKSDNINSFKHYEETLDYIEIDEGLARLLMDPESRMVLKSSLLEQYFGGKLENFLHEQPSSRRNRYLENLAREPQAPFNVFDLDSPKTKKKFLREEEKFERDTRFAAYILQFYKETCCVSRLHIEHPSTTLVDACHIIEHHISGDDHPRNGIALTPTLHRAFDMHLFTITEDYRVKVSSRFNESKESRFQLKPFDGKEILLPANREFYPDPLRLRVHNDHFLRKENA